MNISAFRWIAQRGILLSAAMALCAGCLVQSLQPCCTSGTETNLSIEGRWQLVRDMGSVIAGDTNSVPRYWVLQGTMNNGTSGPPYQVAAVEANGPTSQLHAVFFVVSGRLYGDVAASATRAENHYWRANNLPLHTLGRVELSNDVLRFQLLNRDWFQPIATNKPGLPPWINVGRKVIVTAPTAAWRTFLETYGSDTNLFSTHQVFEFRYTPQAWVPAP